MDNRAMIGLCFYAMGMIGFVAYLGIIGLDNALIVSSSTSVMLFGVYFMEKSAQIKRTTKMEARISALESMIRRQ